MSKYYTVIYSEFDNTWDGFARVLGTYDTKEKAKRKMNNDKSTYEIAGDYEITVDSDTCFTIKNDQEGYQWQILEIDTKE